MWCSTFGLAFHKCAEALDARVKHDGFEASILEIDQADLSEFLETLHTT
jgi:hypothetical protein